MKTWKIRKFFGDVVYDLRNRGLLPVAVLLLVAIVAVPMVISRGGSTPPPPPDTAALAAASKAAPEGESAVLAYNPGLRDYKKRLAELQAKDPFEQQFSQATAAASELSGTVAGTGTATETTTPTTGSGTTGSSGGSGGSPKSKKKKPRYVSYQTDVLFGDVSATLEPHTKLAALSMLPNENAPVLVYLGLNGTASYALFLVSNNVSSVTGPGVCLPNPDDCSLLSLQAGQTADMVYDTDGKTYRIQVVGIKRVVSSKPPSG